jgi:hypothetical protein
LRISQKGPTERADPCHKAHTCASARTGLPAVKTAKFGAGPRSPPWRRSIAAADPVAGLPRQTGIPKLCTSAVSAAGPPDAPETGACAKGERDTIYSGATRLGNANRSTMTVEKDNDGQSIAAPAKNPRADRLKQALRENLKRRKSQAKGRGDITIATSHHGDVAPDHDSGKKPGQ